MNLKFYLQKRRFVSAACRLAPMEEALLLTECKSRSMDAMMVTRQYYLELTGSLTNVQPVEVPLRYPPFKTQVFDWDAVSDDTILVRKQSSLGGALGTLLYQRPEHQMFGVEAATRLCAWLDSSFTEIKSQTLRTEVDDGNSIDGQLGFLFIYELATGARRVSVFLSFSSLCFILSFFLCSFPFFFCSAGSVVLKPGGEADDGFYLASMLMRLLKPSQCLQQGHRMSTLRTMAANPQAVEKLPRYEDTRRIKVKGLLSKNSVTKLVRAAQTVLMGLNQTPTREGGLTMATVSSQFTLYELPASFTIAPNLVDRPSDRASITPAVPDLESTVKVCVFIYRYILNEFC